MNRFPLAKLKASSSADVMNTEEKDTTGGESSLHFPTPDGNSDHLLHLLYALDSQGVNNSF